MKKILIIIIFALFCLSVFGQNVMILPVLSGNANSVITISLDIENTDSFSAFQTDIILPEELQYVEQSATLTNRADDHIVSASLLENNVLRIFAYSLSNSPFSGNSGNVLDFRVELSTNPGTFALVLENSIISNANSEDILTGFTNGTLTLLAPDIEMNVSELNFGEVPLLTTKDRSITIHNYGNQVLNISNISTDNEYFEVLGNTNFSINPNSQQTVTIRFHSEVKGEYDNVLQIISNDPDEENNYVDLYVTAFAVNELHMQPATGNSDEEIDISFTIENMEEFSAFQFDLEIPNSLSYSIVGTTLSDRSNGHISSANILENGVRVVAYSLSNEVFSGNSGEVITLTLLVNGIGGHYRLTPQNVIISDVNSENIVSHSYWNYLYIAAPNISGPSSINFGDVSILESKEMSANIVNTGDAELIIDQLQFTSSSFNTDFVLPISIPPQAQIEIPITFSNSVEGNYNGIMKIFSNDPNDNIFEINLEGFAFSPNYMSVCDTVGSPGNYVTLTIDVDNYDEFVAFQFDLNFPPELTFIENSAQLTERADNHYLIQSVINDNQVRLISYSPNQSTFSGNEGAVLTLDFLVSENCDVNQLDLSISEGVLANSNSENILYNTINGVVEIISIPQNVEISYNKISNEINVTWDFVENADSYKVESAPNPEGPFTVIATTQNNSISFESQESVLFVRVRAVREN